MYGRQSEFAGWFRAAWGSGPWEQEAESSNCLTTFRYNDGAIGYVNIAIATDIPKKRRAHCTAEELFQSFGISADSCFVRDSLACEDSQLTEPSATDIVLLRTLYDPRIRAGMTKDEAMPIARRVIAEMVAASPPK